MAGGVQVARQDDAGGPAKRVRRHMEDVPHTLIGGSRL